MPAWYCQHSQPSGYNYLFLLSTRVTSTYVAKGKQKTGVVKDINQIFLKKDIHRDAQDTGYSRAFLTTCLGRGGVVYSCTGYVSTLKHCEMYILDWDECLNRFEYSLYTAANVARLDIICMAIHRI